MPIVSKYSSHQVETLVNQLLETLHQQQATTELSLMCLGNAISHILNTSVPAAQRAAVVASFSQALADAIQTEKS